MNAISPVSIPSMLEAHPTAEHAPGLVHVDPVKYADTVRAYAAAKASKKRLEAEVRAYDAQIKNLRVTLFAALSGAPAGVCNHAVLTVKPGSFSPAALTMKDGRRILWSEVSEVIVGQDFVSTSDVTTLYGGRSNGPDIEVAGEV